MENLFIRVFKNYSTKQKISVVISYLFYVGFVAIVISNFIYNTRNVWSYVLLVFCAVALYVAILREYLKLLNDDATFDLNFKLNPEEAKRKYDLLCERDLFQMYRKDRGLFDVMVAIQEGKGQEALDIIAANEKKFRTTMDTLLIMYYYQMRAYLLLGNTKRINEIWFYVDGIEKMKSKQRPKVFQWDELHGIHEIAVGNRGIALDRFKNVNMVLMNPKEREFILRNIIELSRNQTEKAEYQRKYDELMEIVQLYSK